MPVRYREKYTKIFEESNRLVFLRLTLGNEFFSRLHNLAISYEIRSISLFAFFSTIFHEIQINELYYYYYYYYHHYYYYYYYRNIVIMIA